VPTPLADDAGTYRRDLDRYVLPRFGAYRLGQLPADEIENWLNDEIAAGIASSSVHRHYRTLRRMLQVAVQKQKILTNPCERVDPPRVQKREMRARVVVKADFSGR
jgi:site-specific recombinase XerC